MKFSKKFKKFITKVVFTIIFTICLILIEGYTSDNTFLTASNEASNNSSYNLIL